jgi:hypothetical protein
MKEFYRRLLELAAGIWPLFRREIGQPVRKLSETHYSVKLPLQSPQHGHPLYRYLLPLHELQQVFSAHLTIAQDLAQQPQPDGFPRVPRR